ncbi:LacI family DNA-binding transcriptional regulator [uncultured Roseobacter sp.]|uniref:LacI family DNA-binding transcriptional regulator n=1 Tax=uncultured Roseobacter sp. TaxID=114847 RepID=UPI002628944A|nr:LacI family DNA-binding transcriptional regulator [uncultured Roseobacter sp.]
MTSNRSVPTLYDVAKTAGVSTATVSRCLNSPEQVVEHTRKRVLEVVHQLGYTPNFGARAMAAKRTYTIGAVIPTMENAIFARGLQAFQEELRARGYTLLVSSSAYDPQIEEEQIRALIARGADGLLLIGHDRTETVAEYLEKQGTPALAAWSFEEKGALPSVGFDNRRAMQALAEEVLALGHQRIGVISGITSGNDRARRRVEGIRDAVAGAGLAENCVTVVETPYDIANGADAFATLMHAADRPTAVMCGNDVLAAGALKAAREMGVCVPHDVSVTGFDDIELAGILSPSLTTVHVPHREMGRKAAQALMSMVQHGTSGKTALLETHVCLRGSLAAPGGL